MSEGILPAGRMLDRMLREFLDPVLKPAGFARRGRRYLFESEHGDVLHVELRDRALYTTSNTKAVWWIATAAMARYDGVAPTLQKSGTAGFAEEPVWVPSLRPPGPTDFKWLVAEGIRSRGRFEPPQHPLEETAAWPAWTSSFHLPLDKGVDGFDEQAGPAASFIGGRLVEIADKVHDQRRLARWLIDQVPEGNRDRATPRIALSVLLDTAPVEDLRIFLAHYDYYVALPSAPPAWIQALPDFDPKVVASQSRGPDPFRDYVIQRLAQRAGGVDAAPMPSPEEFAEPAGVFRWSRGFAGSYLLARWAGELSELRAIDARTQGLEAAGEFGGGWRIGSVDAEDLAEDVEAILAEVVEQTGSPALLAYCFEGAAVLDGFCAAGGYWRGCLGRELMAILAAEQGEDFDAGYADVEEAVQRSVAWAQAAGWTPDREALVEVLSRDRPAGSSVEPLLWRYFQALGLS